MSAGVERKVSREPVVRHYRGATRQEVEQAYHDDAAQALRAGYLPVAQNWSHDWQGFLLAATYRHEPTTPAPTTEATPTSAITPAPELVGMPEPETMPASVAMPASAADLEAPPAPDQQPAVAHPAMAAPLAEITVEPTIAPVAAVEVAPVAPPMPEAPGGPAPVPSAPPDEEFVISESFNDSQQFAPHGQTTPMPEQGGYPSQFPQAPSRTFVPEPTMPAIERYDAPVDVVVPSPATSIIEPTAPAVPQYPAPAPRSIEQPREPQSIPQQMRPVVPAPQPVVPAPQPVVPAPQPTPAMPPMAAPGAGPLPPAPVAAAPVAPAPEPTYSRPSEYTAGLTQGDYSAYADSISTDEIEAAQEAPSPAAPAVVDMAADTVSVTRPDDPYAFEQVAPQPYVPAAAEPIAAEPATPEPAPGPTLEPVAQATVAEPAAPESAPAEPEATAGAATTATATEPEASAAEPARAMNEGRQAKLTVQTLDLHCAGEPLRIIRSGFPDVPSMPVLERRQWVKDHADHVRRSLINEPRGHRDMYGAILLPPYTDYADMCVLFMHNEGYSTMCGHGIIAITTGLIEEGLFPATEPVTTIRYEVPAGIVAANAATMRLDDGTWAVQGVRFTNVPSYLAAQSLPVRPDGVELHGMAAEYGRLTVDLAFGGAYYGIVNAAELGLRIVPEQADALRRAGAAITDVLRREHTPAHPTDADLSFVYGTIIVDYDPRTSPDGRAKDAHLRNATIFADAELDRSPCGSGTSAILAQLHARGRIKVGQEIVNAGITGEHFLGRIEAETTLGPYPAVSTSIAGTAYVTGYSTFVVDSRDPLGEGFLLS